MEGTNLIDYGALGAMMIVLIAFIYFIMKNHKEERKEWREEMRLDREKSDKVIDRNSDSLKELTSVVQGIKLLIESVERKVKI